MFIGELRRAFARYEEGGEDAKFWLGRALQLAGQTEEAETQFADFRREAEERYGGLTAAVRHYEDLFEDDEARVKVVAILLLKTKRSPPCSRGCAVC